MPSVDVHFPYVEMSDEQRQRLSLPDKLRGIKDRELAQLVFNGWLSLNPETAKRYEHNPQHWNGT